MADKLLKSVTYPGLPDKYIIGDTGLNTPGAAADSKATGDTLAGKANIDGSYENLTAGNAEQLTTDIRANDQTPYLFRTSGGSVDIGDREYINGIVGGTVAFNQLAPIITGYSAYLGAGSTSGDTFIFTADATTVANSQVYKSTPLPANHKYLSLIQAKPTKAVQFRLTYYSGSSVHAPTATLTANVWNTIGAVVSTSANTTQLTMYPNMNAVLEVGDTVEIKNFMVFDLTQMFGSTIADYIYSLEQATAGAGVAFFKTLFPKPYYAYNAGELKSVKGLVSHDMVGFNAWDEEWESGAINGADGSAYADASKIRSKNFIPVVGGTTYYVKAPSVFNYAWYDADKSYISGDNSATANYTRTAPVNARYLKFSIGGTTYNHDICINLAWDNSRNGEYEPYQKWSYPLDSDLELRGKFKLDANNNLYADGDVYPPSGQVQRKWTEEKNLGNMSFDRTQIGGNYFFYRSLNGSGDHVKAKFGGGVIDTRHISVNVNTSWASFPDKGMLIANSESYPVLYIRDDAYSDAATFKTAMNGVYMVYELATPTTETADPYTNPQIVDDFGTEEFVISNTVAVPIPVGHNTDYPINLKAKVEMMPNSPDGDGDYIVRQTNGTNEYVSIANNSTISGLVSRSPVASGADGTYVLKATISGGTVTYSWEAEQ